MFLSLLMYCTTAQLNKLAIKALEQCPSMPWQSSQEEAILFWAFCEDSKSSEQESRGFVSFLLNIPFGALLDYAHFFLPQIPNCGTWRKDQDSPPPPKEEEGRDKHKLEIIKHIVGDWISIAHSIRMCRHYDFAVEKMKRKT